MNLADNVLTEKLTLHIRSSVTALIVNVFVLAFHVDSFPFEQTASLNSYPSLGVITNSPVSSLFTVLGLFSLTTPFTTVKSTE